MSVSVSVSVLVLLLLLLLVVCQPPHPVQHARQLTALFGDEEDE
jgi:hypothetical protein